VHQIQMRHVAHLTGYQALDRPAIEGFTGLSAMPDLAARVAPGSAGTVLGAVLRLAWATPG